MCIIVKVYQQRSSRSSEKNNQLTHMKLTLHKYNKANIWNKNCKSSHNITED